MLKKIFIVIILFFAASPLAAEYLFLKDGSIIKGNVINETRAVITFRSDEDKKAVRYPREDVMRVLYMEIKMSRVYVQMRTGEVHRVFVVDEDRDSYTFRQELFEPAEFKVNRTDVLFMAERNPTGLKGKEPGVDSIELEWLPSFEKMGHYNVYYRKKGEDYAAPVRARQNKYLLRGLESNTEYTVQVTGYAGHGDETTPSNEFTFITSNRRPNPPAGLSLQSDDSGKTKLNWQPAVDPDGEVVEYRIYGVKDKERKFLGKVKSTEYTAKAGADYDRFIVTAIDDRGAESGDGVFRKPRVFDAVYTAGFTGGIIYPIGNFSDLTGMGYGGSFNIIKHNMLFSGFEAGFSAGFYYMPGKDDIGTEIQNVDRAYFVPLLVSAGYRFIPTKSVHIVPYISGGAAYFDMTYEDYNGGSPEERHFKALGPMVSAGFLLDFNIGNSFFMGIRSEFGLLITSNIPDYGFVKVEAATGFRF